MASNRSRMRKTRRNTRNEARLRRKESARMVGEIGSPNDLRDLGGAIPTSAVAGVAEDVAGAVGTPNTFGAPGDLRRFFRFSQLAVGEAGATRKMDDIWATVLNELEDLEIPAEARDRLKELGPEKILGGKAAGIPASVATVAGGKDKVRAIKEVQELARTALRGKTAGQLTSEWKQFLGNVGKLDEFSTPEGARLLKELRAADPAVMARIGAAPATSVLIERGGDPFIQRMANKVLGREGLGKVPESFKLALDKAGLSKAPKGAAKALRGAGVKGLGLGGKLGRIAGRGPLGVGLGAAVLGFEAMRIADITGRGERAKKQALQGFQEGGPTSSMEFLRAQVNQQEALSRRKVVLQQFEPELFHEVARALGEAGRGATGLTSTERRIGASPDQGVAPQGRSNEDTNLLLNEFFKQLGAKED